MSISDGSTLYKNQGSCPHYIILLLLNDISFFPGEVILAFIH